MLPSDLKRNDIKKYNQLKRKKEIIHDVDYYINYAKDNFNNIEDFIAQYPIEARAIAKDKGVSIYVVLVELYKPILEPKTPRVDNNKDIKYEDFKLNFNIGDNVVIKTKESKIRGTIQEFLEDGYVKINDNKYLYNNIKDSTFVSKEIEIDEFILSLENNLSGVCTCPLCDRKFNFTNKPYCSSKCARVGNEYLKKAKAFNCTTININERL